MSLLRNTLTDVSTVPFDTAPANSLEYSLHRLALRFSTHPYEIFEDFIDSIPLSCATQFYILSTRVKCSYDLWDNLFRYLHSTFSPFKLVNLIYQGFQDGPVKLEYITLLNNANLPQLLPTSKYASS